MGESYWGYTTFQNNYKIEVKFALFHRLLEVGHMGFVGGLSADNYTKIAKTSASTATRDLKDLTSKQILVKTGALKGTRYSLNMKKTVS